MNECIDIQFKKNGKTLKVKRQLPSGAIEFDEPDPIQRTVAIAFDGANDSTRYRMRRIRQLRGWNPGQFNLRLTAEGGSLMLRGVDQMSLPEGRYTLDLRIEESKTKRRARTVTIDEDGYADFVVDVEFDDRDVAIDIDDCDTDIGRVIAASGFDDQDAATWLASTDWRPTRKACVLNLLASLRTRPSLTVPLIAQVQRLFMASNDRVYARVDAALLDRLEQLAQDPKKPFYREGTPHADIHRKLIDAIPLEERPLFSPDALISFRGEGKPSLQIVIAQPPAGTPFTYAEFDLDLGNSLQDVEGFVIHMAELFDGKPTNHLDLHKLLAKGKARDFLYYTVNA